MPYVKQERRPALDPLVKALGEELEINGDLNYVLYALCKRYVVPGYNQYKNYIGELNETVAEIRRRMLAEYEDDKIFENGDVE
jgi:hypothetical protein